jgi:AcrR family transcriptional regulator
VGDRGARTRRQIIDVALVLFAQRGMHEVAVEDIAEAAGVSRATLYQYFESKDQLFQDLAAEAGHALRRTVKRVGPLGPTSQGFDNLHWWIGEWLWVYDKYATVLIQWAGAESPSGPLRTLTDHFMERYLSRLTLRLEASALEGIEARAAAMTVLALLERFNYLRHTRHLRMSNAELVNELAVTVQLYLFPHTPVELLVHTDDDDA